MNEIILGDYTVTPGSFMLGYYDIYLHNKKIGFVVFDDDMSLRRIFTNDTDLITMLLLKYQVSPVFKIYPYEIILGDYAASLNRSVKTKN